MWQTEKKQKHDDILSCCATKNWIFSLNLELLDYSIAKNIVIILNVLICFSYPFNFAIYCGMSRCCNCSMTSNSFLKLYAKTNLKFLDNFGTLSHKYLLPHFAPVWVLLLLQHQTRIKHQGIQSKFFKKTICMTANYVKRVCGRPEQKSGLNGVEAQTSSTRMEENRNGVMITEL